MTLAGSFLQVAEHGLTASSSQPRRVWRDSSQWEGWKLVEGSGPVRKMPLQVLREQRKHSSSVVLTGDGGANTATTPRLPPRNIPEHYSPRSSSS